MCLAKSRRLSPRATERKSADSVRLPAHCWNHGSREVLSESAAANDKPIPREAARMLIQGSASKGKTGPGEEDSRVKGRVKQRAQPNQPWDCAPIVYHQVTNIEELE